ncbi:MAG: universal stress protein [Symploca sp. SIO2G7]|nr:universal stress protein [Symploca sp. SIO2G7]
MIEKILLPVAGRGLCEEMFNTLMEIPSLKQVSVTVLHVVPPQISAQNMSAKLEEGEQILADAVKALKIKPNKITPRLQEGDPKVVIPQIAEEEGSDLIIMGSRGLKRLESVLKNSVSQYVFQLSTRSLLLVKDDTFIKRVKRVMVAINQSEAAQQSLDLALSLVRDISGVKLHLAHINPDLEKSDGEEDPVLADAVAKAKRQGVTYICHNSVGQVEVEICRLAEELNIDLLILGSPDRRPSVAKALVDLDRLLGNSLSDYVRVNANCPVLLIRSNI